jgi:outer membrane protein W
MKSIKICLYIAALSWIAPASAQQKGSFLIGINTGVSVPTGNWGKTSTASSLMSINGTVGDVHGYAKTGAYVSVDGAWFFSEHFGIGAMVKYGNHDLRGIDSLSQGYEESFDVDTTRTTHTSYKIWSFMPGLYYHLGLASKLSFTARFLAGLAAASTPEITVTIEDGGVFDPPVEQYSASKIAPAFDAGLGLSYALNRSLLINLQADYFYTKPDFSISNSHRNTNAGREVYQYDQPLTSVNASVGIAYNFGKK